MLGKLIITFFLCSTAHAYEPQFTIKDEHVNQNFRNIAAELRNLNSETITVSSNVTINGGDLTLKNVGLIFSTSAGSYGITFQDNTTLLTAPITSTSTIESQISAILAALSTATYTIGDYIVTGNWTFDNIITGAISGNAGTVTNGVYTTGSYSDPAWITSLSTSKIDLSTVTSVLDAHAAALSTGVYTTESYSDPAWITSLSTSKIDLSTVTSVLDAHAAALSTAAYTPITNTFTSTNTFRQAITAPHYRIADIPVLSTTAYGVKIGEYSGVSNTGEYNTYLGYNSGKYQSSGPNNTFIGYNAGYGGGFAFPYSSNTVIGANAGSDLQGDGNILIGYNAHTPAQNTDDYLNIGGKLVGNLATSSGTWLGDFHANNVYAANLISSTAAIQAQIDSVAVSTGTNAENIAAIIASTQPLAWYTNWDTAYSWGDHAGLYLTEPATFYIVQTTDYLTEPATFYVVKNTDYLVAPASFTILTGPYLTDPATFYIVQTSDYLTAPATFSYLIAPATFTISAGAYLTDPATFYIFKQGEVIPSSATGTYPLTANSATYTISPLITNTESGTNYLTFVQDTGGYYPLKTTTAKLFFNSATGALSATSFSGSGSDLTGVLKDPATFYIVKPAEFLLNPATFYVVKNTEYLVAPASFTIPTGSYLTDPATFYVVQTTDYLVAPSTEVPKVSRSGDTMTGTLHLSSTTIATSSITLLGVVNVVNGKLGISTTAPAELLGIQGNALFYTHNQPETYLRIQSTLPNSSPNVYLKGPSNGGGSGMIRFEDGFDNASYGGLFYDFVSSYTAVYTDTSAKLYVLQNGNVGIGNAGPTSKLHVEGDTTITSSLTVQGNAFSVGASTLVVNNGRVLVGKTAPYSAAFDVTGNISNTGQIISSGTGTNYFAGNVGISTTNPIAKLTVIGANGTSGGTPVSYAQYIQDNAGSNGLQMLTANDNVNVILFGEVANPDSGRIRYDHSADSMGLWTNDTARITILSGGNVGIGTATPIQKLEISSGTIHMAGTGTPAKGAALCLTAAGTLGTCTGGTFDACTCTAP